MDAAMPSKHSSPPRTSARTPNATPPPSPPANTTPTTTLSTSTPSSLPSASTIASASSSPASVTVATPMGVVGVLGTGVAAAAPAQHSNHHHHQQSLPQPLSNNLPANKILGRNTNGTLVMTSIPSNEAELQLYRVMQRASLLAYYDTLLEMGGDDVQQLCEAGEEEFLEIMALVGMASKPLHVRRLQKALQEWFNNPAQFQVPLGPAPSFAPAISRTAVGAGTPSGTPVGTPMGTPLGTPLGTPQGTPMGTPLGVPPGAGPSPPHSSPAPSPAPAAPPPADCPSPVTRSVATPPSPAIPADPMQTAVGSIPTTELNNHHGYPGRPLSAPLASPRPGSPGLQLTPVLLESQINRLAEAARNLSRSLPSYQPRPHNTKKKMCKDLELVINMADDDPRRMDEIRKYAAIYGRFDCKRKPEKPLTLHEVSVNEAAAQICRFVPALLTRRDELFPLARQVVRDSGYLYSKGHTNLSYYRPRGCPNGDDILTAGHKRPRLEPSGSPDSSEGDRQRRQVLT